MPFRLRISLLATAFVGMAQAQEACNSFDGQTVHPARANMLWKKLATVPNVKGEYETTAAFETRVANALGDLAGPVTLEIPLDAKYMVYDADASRLDIQSYAFTNASTNYSGVFGYGTPFDGKFKYGSSDNIQYVFPSEEVALGSYTGVTAMGAKIRVAKVRRNTKAIFEREAQWDEHLLSNTGRVMMFDNISPATAKQMKATFKAAIVFTPKAPYFAKGKFPWGEPTLDGPIDIDETIEVAVGNFQCALLLDGTGKVYASAATARPVAQRPMDSNRTGTGGYGARAAAAIRSNITFLEVDSLSGNPAVEIEVQLAPDGTIFASSIFKTSGSDTWDAAALRGVQRTDKLPSDVDGKVPAKLTVSLRPKR